MITFSNPYYADKKDHIGFSLRNISKDFATLEKSTTGLNGNVYEFSIDHRVVKANDIKNIHAYLMKKRNVDSNFPMDTKKLFH